MRTHEIDTRPARPADREHRVVYEHLETWEQRSLLGHEQVETIRQFEERERVAGPRIPLITEVVAYVGAALAVGAVVALVGPHWDDITHGQKLLASALIAVALVVAGAFLRGVEEPAVRRLAGVLWTLAIAGMTGFLALVLFDLPAGQDPAPWSAFAIDVTVAVVAAVMLLFLPSTPLLVAMFVGSVTAVLGAWAWAVDAGWTWLEDKTAWNGVAILVVSLLYLLAGVRDVLRPRMTAMTLGAVGMVVAPLFAMDPPGFGQLLGVGVAIVLLAASVWQRSTPMLVAGAIGLFFYLVAAIVYFLSDTVGTPIALLLSGVALMGVAVVTARLKRFTGGGDDAAASA